MTGICDKHTKHKGILTYAYSGCFDSQLPHSYWKDKLSYIIIISKHISKNILRIYVILTVEKCTQLNQQTQVAQKQWNMYHMYNL